MISKLVCSEPGAVLSNMQIQQREVRLLMHTAEHTTISQLQNKQACDQDPVIITLDQDMHRESTQITRYSCFKRLIPVPTLCSSLSFSGTVTRPHLVR